MRNQMGVRPREGEDKSVGVGSEETMKLAQWSVCVCMCVEAMLHRNRVINH